LCHQVGFSLHDFEVAYVSLGTAVADFGDKSHLTVTALFIQ
jgi:hypothetical protein